MTTRESQVFHVDVRFSNTSWDEAAAMNWHRALETTYMDYAKHYMFQLEKGETTGTYHFQGTMNLKERVRPKALAIKLNDIFKGIRVVATSTNGVKALQEYCMKDDTRVQGPWSDSPVYRGQDLPTELLPYQKQLEMYILGQVNPREIIWIYDIFGNSGKSIWAKYMYFHHKVMKLTWGDTSNMINVIYKTGAQRAYIFDLSRTKPKAFSNQDLYSAIEDIKNGYIVNSKYETGILTMNPPHIVVLANHLPDTTAISADRWNILSLPKGCNPYAKEVMPTFSFSEDTWPAGCEFQQEDTEDDNQPPPKRPRMRAPEVPKETYSGGTLYEIPAGGNMKCVICKKDCLYMELVKEPNSTRLIRPFQCTKCTSPLQ